jgi:2-desacetyl-2-hydroxyethyl bacteriochlorophyllide A dehydrogenase
VKLAVLKAPQRIELVEEPVPEPAAGEVLLRVASCGVCASELDMWEGRADVGFPRFPGHEVSGVVERAGPGVEDPRPGDAVAAWVTTRGFAEYVVVRAEHCFPAGSVPLDLALAEPLACAVGAVELAAPALGDDVLIVGAGFMGNLVQKLVQLKGPRHVIVADTRPDALALASRLGATRTVDVRTESLPDAVREATGGAGADVSFEVTGAQGALSGLGDATRMSGKVAIVGFHQGGMRELPLGAWNWMAFEIVNAHFRDVATIMRGMRAGMRLLTSGRVALDDLVTHRFALDDVNDAFATAVAKPHGFVKAVVTLPRNPTTIEV